MNFKKFISGVGALAIAASAFAGMAVTANAEAAEVDYIGSSTVAETFDSATFSNGTWDPALSASLGNNGIGVVAEPGFDAASEHVAGAALGFRKRGGGSASAKYTLDSTITNGTVTLKTGIATLSNVYDGGSIALVDANGVEIAKVTYPNGNSAIKLNANGTEVSTANTYTRQAPYDSYVTIVADLDNKTVSVNLNYYRQSSSNYTNSSVNGTLADGANVAGLVISQSSRSSTNETIYLDNTQFYAVTDASTAADYTINYVYNNNSVSSVVMSGEKGTVPTISTDPITVSGQKYIYVSDNASTLTIANDGSTVVTINVRPAETYTITPVSSLGDNTFAAINVVEGESGTYYFPRYYVTSAGKLAKADSTDFAKTVSPTATGNDTVAYTLQNVDVFQFVEMADDTDPAAYPQVLSNGKFQNIGETETNVMTVGADGIYTVEFVMGSRSAANASNTLTLKVNGTDLVTQASAAWSPFVSKADVELHAGDVISAVGNNSRISLDYVLITKTGDLTPAPSAVVIDISNVKTFSGEQYDGTATAALVTVDYANMLADKKITLTYNGNGTKKDVATQITGTSSLVVAAIIANVVDENPEFTAGVE